MRRISCTGSTTYIGGGAVCVCVCMYVCVASKYKLDIGREDSMPREVDNLFPTSSII